MPMYRECLDNGSVQSRNTKTLGLFGTNFNKKIDKEDEEITFKSLSNLRSS